MTREELLAAMAKASCRSIWEGQPPCGGICPPCNDGMNAVLVAIEQSDWAVVPKVPTEEMVNASRRALGVYIKSLPASERAAVKGYAGGFRLYDESVKARVRYAAMVDAAPK